MNKSKDLFLEIFTADAFYLLGKIYHIFGRFDQSKIFLEKSLLAYVKQLGEECSSVACLYCDLGQLMMDIGDLPEANKFLIDSLNLRKKLLGENHKDTANTFGILGRFYFQNLNYPESKKYLEKSLEISKRLFKENHEQIANLYFYLGRTACAMGVSYKNQDIILDSNLNFEDSEEFFRKSLDILLNIGQKKKVDYVNVEMSYLYYYMGNFENALNFLDEALQNQTKSYENCPENNILLCRIYTNYGEVYLMKKETNMGLLCFLKAYFIAYTRIQYCNHPLRKLTARNLLPFKEVINGNSFVNSIYLQIFKLCQFVYLNYCVIRNDGDLVEVGRQRKN